MNLSKMCRNLLAMMLAVIIIVPAIPAYAASAAVNAKDAELITRTDVYIGSFVEGSNNTEHYYKFKTRPQKVAYTLMAQLRSYKERGMTNLYFEIFDSKIYVLLSNFSIS